MKIIGLRYKTAQDRFWEKVIKTDTCWLWQAGLFSDGYGAFTVNGKTRRAHRVVFEWVKGEIPKGLYLDHSCHVRHCVNPDHLCTVTQRQNTQNKKGKGTKYSSKYPGVTWFKRNEKWGACAQFNGKNRFLGLFESELEAFLAYRAAVGPELHGLFE